MFDESAVRAIREGTLDATKMLDFDGREFHFYSEKHGWHKIEEPGLYIPFIKCSNIPSFVEAVKRQFQPEGTIITVSAGGVEARYCATGLSEDVAFITIPFYGGELPDAYISGPVVLSGQYLRLRLLDVITWLEAIGADKSLVDSFKVLTFSNYDDETVTDEDLMLQTTTKKGSSVKVSIPKSIKVQIGFMVFSFMADATFKVQLVRPAPGISDKREYFIDLCHLSREQNLSDCRAGIVIALKEQLGDGWLVLEGA